MSSASDSQVLGNAAAALRNLARDEASRPRIVQEGAVGPLVQVRSSISQCSVVALLVSCAIVLTVSFAAACLLA